MSRYFGLLLLLSLCASGSATTLIGGDIHDIAFAESANPYVVEQDAFVPEGKSLAIPAGVVFMFKPFTGLRIDGSLEVKGTSDKPVVFTSINDSKHGPATEQLPNPFDWNGVQINATSKSAVFRHAHVMFGVFGVNSQTPGVALDNCVFAQNGQFHFKAADQLQYVQDRIPYSFNVASAQTTTAKPVVSTTSAKDPWTAKTDDTPRSARVFRYVCLGAGVVGAGLGTLFLIQANQAEEERESAANQAIWDDTEQDRQSKTIGGVVSYSVAGALLIGFGVSFAF
jgi:hypothetical protein